MTAVPAAGAALVIRRPERAYLEVRGTARAGFLHRLLTSDVVGQAAATHAGSLLLDGRGHIVAMLDLWATTDVVLVGLAAARVELVLQTLRRYVLRDDVSIEPLEHRASAVVGSGAVAAVAAAFGIRPDADLTSIAGGTVLRSPAPWIELVTESGRSDALYAQIMAAADVAVGEPGDYEMRRVEAGIPRDGAELTGQEFPQELRLESAVDFRKGCYLGQETVARIHYRGHVNRLLCGVRPSRPVVAGAGLHQGAKHVGKVTSAVESARLGPIALALVRREQAEPGTELHSDGSPARVVTLPFAE